MKIGITGTIASGKSTVSGILRKLGEKVICADQVARDLTKPGEQGAAVLRSVFGDIYFDEAGHLNRRKLAAVVFRDENKRKMLNEALHPLIISSIMEKPEMQGRVFVDAALLVQSGMHKMMDAVWLVTADNKTRIQRLMQRDAMDRKAALLRISAQQPDDVLKRYAHEIITNNGSVQELEQKIFQLLKRIKQP